MLVGCAVGVLEGMLNDWEGKGLLTADRGFLWMGKEGCRGRRERVMEERKR